MINVDLGWLQISMGYWDLLEIVVMVVIITFIIYGIRNLFL